MIVLKSIVNKIKLGWVRGLCVYIASLLLELLLALIHLSIDLSPEPFLVRFTEFNVVWELIFYICICYWCGNTIIIRKRRD